MHNLEQETCPKKKMNEWWKKKWQVCLKEKIKKTDIENKQKICPINRKKIKRANKDLLAYRKKILTSKDSIYKRGPNCPNWINKFCIYNLVLNMYKHTQPKSYSIISPPSDIAAFTHLWKCCFFWLSSCDTCHSNLIHLYRKPLKFK